MALRLREWRQKRALSLRALADRTDVSFVTIARVENGRLSPTVTTLEKLAKGLGITVRDLFAVERKPQRKRRRA